MNLARGRGARHTYDLPLTSLIDVVFLLLVYFLLTLSLNQRESDLASALQQDKQGAGKAADLTPQIVRVELVDGKAVYRLGERVFGSQRDLRAVLEALPKEGGVFVRGSNLAPVSAVAGALQACKDAGFTKVTYVPTK
ncbi:MAG: biopolymer transporter ExbD [Phycisphaerales bacterium]|nr:biopolymer transporter ExbD [Phycisphaerales bacterium]